ncbi:hypothetical protein CCHR01_08890 [Colletotrichum chrysophilum]|uniref:Uncharacterized protein n=1 Tax=Colletotrichum chrysophilum TaxID=1836956 RepID=A0AAD9AJ08_9PEZI|nr:hypothetical protein CCHR01_08890 [Colletotrichum chrysophilum]
MHLSDNITSRRTSLRTPVHGPAHVVVSGFPWPLNVKAAVQCSAVQQREHTASTSPIMIDAAAAASMRVADTNFAITLDMDLDLDAALLLQTSGTPWESSLDRPPLRQATAG